jgi:hypothetical protein
MSAIPKNICLNNDGSVDILATCYNGDTYVQAFRNLSFDELSSLYLAAVAERETTIQNNPDVLL